MRPATMGVGSGGNGETFDRHGSGAPGCREGYGERALVARLSTWVISLAGVDIRLPEVSVVVDKSVGRT